MTAGPPARTTNVLFAGVGGQGIILASDLLAEVALAAGLEAKKSEVHGMAQRGGSVVSHVRFGSRVWSPLIPEGEADFLVAFEEMEALRYLAHLRPGGLALINRQRIYTLAMLLGGESYPAEAGRLLTGLPVEMLLVDGLKLAERAGNAKTVNVALLGVLAARLSFSHAIWLEVVSRRLPPKILAVNREAFRIGTSWTMTPAEKT
jgi:indolepyruvate ferredoxin oxidoreductase beta subunit